nr:unnamed protein product [Callosobruchus chinensis]CAH7754399.1 unnamed protein product [Callosobruchus chinensis]
MTHLCPQIRLQEPKCAKCRVGHPANSPTCKLAPRKNLQVIEQRRNVTYAHAVTYATLTASSSDPSASPQRMWT